MQIYCIRNDWGNSLRSEPTNGQTPMSGFWQTGHLSLSNEKLTFTPKKFDEIRRKIAEK